MIDGRIWCNKCVMENIKRKNLSRILRTNVFFLGPCSGSYFDSFNERYDDDTTRTNTLWAIVYNTIVDSVHVSKILFKN